MTFQLFCVIMVNVHQKTMQHTKAQRNRLAVAEIRRFFSKHHLEIPKHTFYKRFYDIERYTRDVIGKYCVVKSKGGKILAVREGEMYYRKDDKYNAVAR